MAAVLVQHWYRKSVSWLMLLLLPLSWLFRMIVVVRRYLYRLQLLKSYRFNVPVIVVGNITVGGTGKTPFVIWLAGWLQQQGYKNPGIVCRGVGSIQHNQPYLVTARSSVKDAGDEAIMLAQKTLLPVVIYPDRVRAVQYLLHKCGCDVVISDDGLQHYRLARDLEIVIVDNARQFGNQQSLPAGPLREPISRLKEVNLTIVNGGDAKDQFSFSVVPGSLVSLGSVEVKNISDMQGETVHAVAGIGNPERFFTLLEESGIKVIKHVFPDHYYFQKKDIMFHDEYPVIMTEKDAVKCRQFGLANSWYLQIAIEPNARLQESLLSQIKKVEVGPCKTN